MTDQQTSSTKPASRGARLRWYEKDARPAATQQVPLTQALAGVAKAWTKLFSALSATPGEMAFKTVATIKLDDLMAARQPHAILATLHSFAWNATLGVEVERTFLATVMEALFGGAGEDEPFVGDGPLSPVEASIADVVGRHAADSMTAGFADLLPTTFVYEGLYPKPDMKPLGGDDSVVMRATFSLATLGRSVDVHVLLPRPAIEAITAKLADAPEPSGPADPGWTTQLEAELSQATVTLQAMVDLQPLTLGAIAALQAGQTLALPPDAGSRIKLLCENGELFRCELGQSDGFFTVRVEAASTETSSRKAH